MLVFFCFYPCCFPWLSLDTLTMIRNRGLKPVTIFHEVPVTGFDALIYPDPTFRPMSRQLNDWYSIGRPLPGAVPERPCSGVPAHPIIGTSGFGFGWKGHETLVRLVVKEFDQATVRMRLPFAKWGDPSGDSSRQTADNCRKIVEGTGIKLEIDHDFLPTDQFVQWLAKNDLNCYLYNGGMSGRGISSVTDHALAARRPIALTKTAMFRHLHHIKGIWVEDSSLSEIMARGIEPLRPVYEQFSAEAIVQQVDQVLEKILLPQKGMNRLLTDDDRHGQSGIIHEMTRRAPEMMGRKIPEANVQQAWVLEMVRRTKAQRILSVGCFEDTAFEMLKDRTIGIDPALNYDLETFRKLHPSIQFECIFSTSVLEHVPNDGQFIASICDLLAPDGVAILTADFKADYRPGDPLPATDVRLYTTADIERLSQVLKSKGCYWVDKPDLSGQPDFVYQGHHYSFVCLTFKKL